MIAGNGGSASDAEHIVGELMKSFVLPRKLSDEVMQKLIGVNKELGKELAEKLITRVTACNRGSGSCSTLNGVSQ